VPSGGARARSGPPADPTSGRSESGRNAKDGWTTLPAKPAITRAPKWPLDLQSAPEKALWSKLWRKPQATMWRRQGLEFQVAAYARSFLEATEFGSPASLKTAVLRMEDTLGISTVGLTALRWRIATDEVAAARADAAPAPTEEKAPPVRRLRGVPAA
jgi:hypothetical protein